MININNIIENKFYVYITQQNEDYFYFNYRDENTIWITAYSLNKSSDLNKRYVVYERFWIHIRNFNNEVYHQGWEAKKSEKENIIGYLFELKFLKAGMK